MPNIEACRPLERELCRLTDAPGSLVRWRYADYAAMLAVELQLLARIANEYRARCPAEVSTGGLSPRHDSVPIPIRPLALHALARLSQRRSAR